MLPLSFTFHGLRKKEEQVKSEQDMAVYGTPAHQLPSLTRASCPHAYASDKRPLSLRLRQLGIRMPSRLRSIR